MKIKMKMKERLDDSRRVSFDLRCVLEGSKTLIRLEIKKKNEKYKKDQFKIV